MEQDHITLNGIRYCARFNWNALTGFLDETGQNDVDALKNFKVTPSSVVVLIWYGLREGERLEGRDFSLTREDIGASLTAPVVESALEIFMRHNGVAGPSKVVDKAKKKNWRLFRRFAKSGA